MVIEFKLVYSDVVDIIVDAVLLSFMKLKFVNAQQKVDLSFQ